MKGNKKSIFISFILALGAFIGLLFVEESVLKPNGTVNGFVAKVDIDKGMLITESNISNYFTEKNNIDGSLEVTGAVKTKEELINKITNQNINKGEVVSINSFVAKDDILAKIENPVETSFNVSDISQVVGGILREGDLIDISIVDNNSKESTKILKNVYVDKAISSDGKEIDRTSDLSALTINIILSESEEKILNDSINKGTIRVSKI
ncbi:SAF domain-containing protein [Clostridium tertium]|uniref:SAF domain-containing protein n=1 Tax=Clostridium tertium TaxID=1559 RepID=UPI0024B3C484|nr:SAF domain-containing protein [Clostridium tertium]MBS6502460.1 SAF domain-containing protein [Clostridium sp.]MDI9218163.1 SAF domain-containing protein [Clostridium tertium]